MIPRIPPPAQRRGRGLLWGLTQIIGGKAPEPETSRPVEKPKFLPITPVFGDSVESDFIGISSRSFASQN